MTANELKQYLTMVVDLEENCYLQKGLMKKLENELEHGLKFSNPGSKPIALDYKMSTFYFETKKTIIVSLILGFVLGFLFAVVAGNVLLMTGHEDLYYDIGVGMLFIPSFIVCTLVVFFLIYSIAKAKHKKRNLAGFNAAKKKLEEKQKAYNESVKWSEERNAQIQSQRDFVKKELEALRERYKESSLLLGLIYAKNIIYPKYQNYVAVSTILDYLLSGRCSQLEGHEGAYNLYENEARLNQIITKLDDVVTAVNRVSQSQFLLARSIEASNQRMDSLYQQTIKATGHLASLEAGVSKMTGRLEELGEASAIAAYNTERIAKEVAYRNIKDNIYTTI